MNLRSGDNSDNRRLGCVVMKFGGTSIEDAAAMLRVVQLLKDRLRDRPVVVVSALAGVTDQLLSAGRAAATGDCVGAKQILGPLRERHHKIAAELLGRQEYDDLLSLLAYEFDVLDSLLSSIA